MRKKKLLLNTSTSLIYQVVSVICGLVIPRIFIQYYGSAINGLVSSIAQFLSFITLLELGVGAVVQSALYKPLAEKNASEISKIIVSAEKFFKRIALIFAGYIFLLVVFYPIIVNDQFGWTFTAALIVVISISTFVQYYFGITYQMLLNADQRAYIQFSVQTVMLLLNAVATIVLAVLGVDVIILKLITSLIFLLRPIVFTACAKKYYHIDHSIKYDGEPIKQKWNGLAQHLASVVLNSTDIVIITLFSTLENVSIYYVYHAVVNGVKTLVTTVTNSVQATIGDMIAKNEHETLDSFFTFFEWLVHTLVTLLFTCTGLLILPFVKVYTANISDVNYYLPAFAILITIAQASYCLRLPYNIAVLAAGHYKQTQSSAIIEALINIVLSIVLVIKFGLVGVAIGTLAAMSYRTVYFAFYLRKNILKRSLKHFFQHIVVDAVCVCLSIVSTYWITMAKVTYSSWIVLAIKISVVCFVIIFTVNLLVYYKQMRQLFVFLRKRRYSA